MIAMTPKPVPPVVTASWPYLARDVAALAGEAAGRVGEVPEVAERLALHEVEQRLVVELARRALRAHRAAGGALASARMAVIVSPRAFGRAACRPCDAAAARPRY